MYTGTGKICDYETGRAVPPAPALVALADALDTTIDYIMMRTDDPSPIGVASEVSPTYFSDEAELQPA